MSTAILTRIISLCNVPISEQLLSKTSATHQSPDAPSITRAVQSAQAGKTEEAERILAELEEAVSQSWSGLV